MAATFPHPGNRLTPFSGVNHLVSRCPTQGIATTAPERFGPPQCAKRHIKMAFPLGVELFPAENLLQPQAILTRFARKFFPARVRTKLRRRRPVFGELDSGIQGFSPRMNA